MREYTKRSLSLLTFIIIFGAILVLVNILGLAVWGRIDLTRDKIYSLSDATKRVLKNMDDEVEITAYFSRDLPARFSSLVQYIKDMLEDYRAYSGGKIHFAFLDPNSDPDIENDAKDAGCPPLTLQQLSTDEFSTKKVYMCLVFHFEDKKELLPAVRSTTGLEYEITSIIKKITAKTLKQVGILQGHGEPQPYAPPVPMENKGNPTMETLRQQLERTYKVVSVDITTDEGKKKLDEVDTLLVISPTKKFEDQDLMLIDQFIMSGKTAAFFIDKISTDLNMFVAKPNDLGIEKLLSHYGVTINTDLILDKSNMPITVTQEAGPIRYQTRIPYPFFPVVRNFRDFTGLNPDVVITQKLEMITFPFVSSLTLKDDMENRTATWIARTSPLSWKQTGFFQINPMQLLPKLENAETGPFVVAAIVSGTFDSYFKDKAQEGQNQSLPGLEGKQFLAKSVKPTRILVVGNGLMCNDRFIDPYNMKFLQNAVDWLVQDEDLISIRSKGYVPKPLDPDLSNTVKNVIKYGNIVGVPTLFLLIGVVLAQLRAARRRKLNAEFFKKK